jgi:hypothetical protein
MFVITTKTLVLQKFQWVAISKPHQRFCINPNESRVQTLPNQLEGRSVKGQVRSAGLAQIGLGGWDIIC